MQLAHRPPPTRRSPWLRRLGLINDYVRIPYANGSSFASQFLHRELARRGHRVTVIGPDDPRAAPHELPARHVALPAVPFRMHPGVRLPLPAPRALSRLAAERFDLVLAQCTSGLLDLGLWLRWTQHIPFVAVNTVHLPSVAEVALPERFATHPRVARFLREHLVPRLQRQMARIYNQSDGLIVLSEGLRSEWQQLGVTVPIHVIERSVDPRIFDCDAGADPFDPRAAPGTRFVTVCRHTREKGLSRLLRIFAERIAPRLPTATLTLVGDGPDHMQLRREAAALGLGGRVFFPGEYPLTDIPRFYRHADCFLYTSLSETYGQVVSEAMWCGMPVVAFADGKGVSHQIDHGRTGLLVEPGPDTARADQQLADHAVRLMHKPTERLTLRARATADVQRRVHPERIIARYHQAFDHARDHCQATTEARIARPLRGTQALAHWTAIQTLAAATGCLRRPTVINRHGRKQPTWSELPPPPGEHASVAAE